MSLLVSETFSGWTDGMGVLRSRIVIFERIRNIPYSLITDPLLQDPEQAPELLLVRGRGSCTPKHYLLAEMYKKLNLPVIFSVFPFLWNNPDIRYPSRLRELAVHLPVCYHITCRVRIGARWVLVDATWDPPLEKAGFPVNMQWDGYSDTQCAVRPLKSAVRTAFCRTLVNEPLQSGSVAEIPALDGEENFSDAKDSYVHRRTRASFPNSEDYSRIAEFYRELDVWLETLRKTGNG
jgi:hypothetical protein